jgi:hypothetical protein
MRLVSILLQEWQKDPRWFGKGMSRSTLQDVQTRNLLAHFSESFTSDTVTTFPVRLVFREEDGAASESMFLQDPSSFVQMAIQDVKVKIIDVLTNVESRAVS